MFDDDPRRDATIIAGLLHERVVRGVFRALVKDRDAEAQAGLVAALGSEAAYLDLADPLLREWLLEALEYRISPPDEDDVGPTRPFDSGSFTLSFALDQAA